MASRNGSSLFGTTYAADDALEALTRPVDNRQFGVLARDFFSRLIRSFLGYFLSRAFPQHVGNNQRFQSIRDHDAFDQALGHHCRETSLIVEKFACDWFSKTNYRGRHHAREGGRLRARGTRQDRGELQVRRHAHG